MKITGTGSISHDKLCARNGMYALHNEMASTFLAGWQDVMAAATCIARGEKNYDRAVIVRADTMTNVHIQICRVAHLMVWLAGEVNVDVTPEGSEPGTPRRDSLSNSGIATPPLSPAKARAAPARAPATPRKSPRKRRPSAVDAAAAAAVAAGSASPNTMREIQGRAKKVRPWTEAVTTFVLPPKAPASPPMPAPAPAPAPAYQYAHAAAPRSDMA